MDKGNRKWHPEANRTRVMEYALLTVLISLGIFACMAFLRYGTG
jgi:Flp pilus assembly pilin Flp